MLPPRYQSAFVPARDVGLTGDAGAMVATMGPSGRHPPPSANILPAVSTGHFTLTGRAAAKVVVGGGIAGLTTACQLGKAGYDRTVLEARDRTGGRDFTVRAGDRTTDLHGTRQTARFADGHYMNAGPARIPRWIGHPRPLPRTRCPP
ncbi:FAD-dependent oxidoreductase [Streptomyces cellulosae]|uniref:FAD-dependent oxidoreductase n=1 Tax=Streptomyces cellulosae TaxID=1968 RepID=A0ABW7Y101_STRCE